MVRSEGRAVDRVVALLVGLWSFAGCGGGGGESGGAADGTGGSPLVASGCLAACERALATPPATGSARGDDCPSLDACLSFCAVVTGSGCGCTADAFEACLSAVAQTCEEETLESSVCATVLPCAESVLPETPLRELNPEQRRWVCARLPEPEADRACSAGVRDEESCVLALEGLLCRCDRAAAGTLGCGLATGDLVACVEAGGPCGAPDDPACAALEAALPAPLPPERRLADLDCGETIRACVQAIPEQGVALAHEVCDGSPAIPVDGDSPVTACVAAVRALGCQCAAAPDSPGCEHDVATLEACVDASRRESCPVLGDGSCVAPGNADASGLASDALVRDVPRETLAEWCRWRTCGLGGAGQPYGTKAGTGVTVPDVDECVADLLHVFEPCPVTLAELEACALGVLAHNDARRRIGRFRDCLDARDRWTCHLLQPQKAPGCDSVRRCWTDVWHITEWLDPPVQE